MSDGQASITVHDLAVLAGKPHRESLLTWAQGATTVRIFVSFLFPEGVALVRELLKLAPVDLTVSTYLRATRKAALVELLDVLKASKSKRLRVRVATGDKDGFHGKVYRYTYGDGTARVVVGSANLSKGGLRGRGEVSMTVAGSDQTVPDLSDQDVPALRNQSWSTNKDSALLEAVIAGYAESNLGRKLGDADSSDVYSFVDVTLASDSEVEAAACVSDADPGELDGEMDGKAEDGDLPLVIHPGHHKAWARMGSGMEIGEVVLLGWKGKKSLRAYRLARRYEGVVSPLRARRIFLFLRRIPSAKLSRKDLQWKNRVVPREDLPSGLLALIDAAPLRQPEGTE